MLVTVTVYAHQHQHADLVVVPAQVLVDAVGVEVGKGGARQITGLPLVELAGPGLLESQQHRRGHLFRPLAEHDFKYTSDVGLAHAS